MGPTKCCHCKGNHSSGHKECPRFIKRNYRRNPRKKAFSAKLRRDAEENKFHGRRKNKETIEHLRSKLTSQQDPQPPSSKKETDDIKRRLEKLESENKQLKEVQAENDKMKKEIEDLKKKQKTYRKQMTNLRLKKKPK